VGSCFIAPCRPHRGWSYQRSTGCHRQPGGPRDVHAAFTSRSSRAPQPWHCQMRTCSGLGRPSSRTASRSARSARTGRSGGTAGREAWPCTPASPRTRTSRRHGRTWPAACGRARSPPGLPLRPLGFRGSAPWTAGGESRAARWPTRACARAALTVALPRFLLPFALRDSACCARLSLFSARRRNRGEAIFLPSDSTAK
jgi:hypothetical protein